MLPQRINQAQVAKFFATLVAGFSDAIGVKSKHIAGREFLVAHRAVPLFKQPEQHAGGIELLDLTVYSQ